MRLPRLLIAFLLLGLAALVPLHAQAVGSPYAVTVPVADTSDAQRSQAFATALGQVMTRVAGGQDLRSNPGYAEALGSATSLVQKFQYQRAASGLVLDVDFAPASVRRLVARLGVAATGNSLVDRLGKQLNVIGAGASEGKLWVRGLESAADYASLLATLNADPSVQQVTTVGAQNDGVLLEVKASLPMGALAAKLAAGGRLLLQGQPHAGADANLRWLHGSAP
ncbi:MAG: DUF2066 domain-containing protein [Rhodanobacter sp.]|nr:MAG: DUF2066 domain-containing protein [Rhodanobacter sp.]TAM39276.1 MAG: DUF2066 domain-containing protein [Rhodanobacter sp.]TAN28732.1 MAG: DUF2066 domain-containing protein [Rhodanobacter sp.]